jgi:antitoxin (DNA-binding transcriptional repressor) of toxin-antitoxin stability system
VDAAEHGQVVYLTRKGQPIAAVMPADVAAAGAAAIEALEDAADLRVARTARDEPGPNMPLADVLARYSEDLAAYPDER